MQKRYWAIMLALFISSGCAVELNKLTEKSYTEAGDRKAVVILQVNWGRYWNCGGLENAQLEALKFFRLQTNEAQSKDAGISLETPSKLAPRNSFLPYALLVEPGEYALSGFDVKAARTKTDIGHLKGESILIKDNKPIGGSFTVGPGEIVYIGHFGLDCAKEPFLWRYYLEGKDEFERYVAGFRKEFPFIQDKPVQFRLFSLYGQDYSLK